MGTDVRGLQRQTLTGLASRLAGTDVHGVMARTRRGPDALRLTWEFGNGVHATILVGTVRQGLPPGRFALEPRLLMSGGPLADAVASLPAATSPEDQAAGFLVDADCALLGGATSTFVIRAGESLGLNRAQTEIGSLLVPAVAAFSGDWAKALDLVLAHPAAVAFAGATAAVLIGWTGRIELIPALREALHHDPEMAGSITRDEVDWIVEHCRVGPVKG